jgi:formamidopyrimidine-DNA glycosylase
MIEIPEGIVLANQLNETVMTKTIKCVTANSSPHRFAWFNGNPDDYNDLLKGKTIGTSISFGGKVEIHIEDMRLVFTEGINLRYLKADDKLPKKHQLLLEFDDGTYLVASVQMYGGMWAFKENTFDNEYYIISKKLPTPISNEFDRQYLDSIIMDEKVQKLSVKAFLATEQRIPGLGNGVLQDILYNAKLHPKLKINTLSDDDIDMLYKAIKSTLNEMIQMGGRNTEKDLFGEKGGYITKASKNTVGKKCAICNGEIIKSSYMGGSVYFCDGCQKV